MNKDKNKERITIEISAELKKKVVVYCAENGIKSVKEFITNLIDFALNKEEFFIKLPCKEDQEVYIISNKRIITTYARAFNYLGKEIGLEIQTTRYEKTEDGWLKLKTKIIHENEFGKTVFLDKLQAQAKLKELQKNEK